LSWARVRKRFKPSIPALELLAERGLHADHVTVGKREAQVPADRKQDDLRVKLTPFEQSGNRWDMEHPSILAARLSGQTSKVAALPFEGSVAEHPTASFLVCSLRPTKLPIIYADFRLDYKLATLP